MVEKKNGDIKAGGCVDGGIHRIIEAYNKEGEKSPTVSTDGVMITCAMEDHGERKVSCFYIPGAYINKLNDKEVIMLITGPLAELLIMIYS